MIVERAYYVGRKSLLCGKKEPTVCEERAYYVGRMEKVKEAGAEAER